MHKTFPLAFAAPTTGLVHVMNTGATTRNQGPRVDVTVIKRFADNVLTIDDVIVGCNHTPVHTATALTTCLDRSAAQRVAIDFMRGASLHHAQVRLIAAP